MEFPKYPDIDPENLPDDIKDAWNEYDNAKSAEMRRFNAELDRINNMDDNANKAKFKQENIQEAIQNMTTAGEDFNKKISDSQPKEVTELFGNFFDLYKFNEDGTINSEPTMEDINGFNYRLKGLSEEGRPDINSNNIAHAANDEHYRKQYNELLDKMGGTNNEGFKNWAKTKLGYEPSLKLDKQIKARLGGKKYGELQKAKTQMKESVQKYEEALKDPNKQWNIEDRNKFDAAGKKINGILKDLGDEWEKKEILADKDPNNAGKPKTRLEYIYKIMFLLSIVGAAITAMIFLLQYCDNHTGCLKIEYDGSSFTQNNIYYCHGKCMVAGNLSNTKTTYLPTQCFCSQYPIDGSPNTKASVPKPLNQCGYASSAEGLNFTADYNDGSGCKDNQKCNPPDGNFTNKDKYVYYAYIVMTPLDGGLDIAHKGIQLTGGLLEMILHAAIVIGIIIGVLLVLYIIYKYVSNRGESETIDVKTAPAPATTTAPKASEYGKYLGDLSKYSNYGLMGKCGTYRMIPK
jgi:hypothetical protein